ncbi:MAG: hypothetical protein Q8M54_00430 [Desulfobaccales bacterium]|nr:hypothetical protein [Desulfobaccales bacterium]
MDWNERRRIAKAINDNIKSNGGKPPIRTDSKVHLDPDLENFFDWADRNDPEIWDDFPPHVREWYRQRKGGKGRGWWRHYRDFTPRLVGLKTLNALKMYLVYRDSANDNDRVNRLGLHPGETCIGEASMARKAGVSRGYLWKGNKELKEAGLVVFVRRLWFNGPFVRRVNMGWERPIEEPTDDGIVRKAYPPFP